MKKFNKKKWLIIVIIDIIIISIIIWRFKTESLSRFYYLIPIGIAVITLIMFIFDVTHLTLDKLFKNKDINSEASDLMQKAKKLIWDEKTDILKELKIIYTRKLGKEGEKQSTIIRMEWEGVHFNKFNFRNIYLISYNVKTGDLTYNPSEKPEDLEIRRKEQDRKEEDMVEAKLPKRTRIIRSIGPTGLPEEEEIHEEGEGDE